MYTTRYSINMMKDGTYINLPSSLGNVPTAISLTHGFCVGTGSLCEPFPVGSKTESEVYQILANSDSQYNGIWTNGGLVYCDTVSIVEDLDEAMKLGRMFNEIAIWDNAGMQEIAVPR